jgi:hypothetical protein
MALTIGEFYQSKSVLPSFKFQGTFGKMTPNKSGGAATSAGDIDDIKPYHIRSVKFDQHAFKGEGQYHGPGIPYSWPVLDKSEGPYNLNISFEEDRDGTILKFIEYCKQLIIKPNGVYQPLSIIKGSLEFKLIIDTIKQITVRFPGIYFLSSGTSDFSYAGDDMKVYEVVFGYDSYEITQQ